jgi:nucleoside-diphosphate-sugar epimerase
MKITIIGNGYTTKFLAEEALKNGYEVSIITRNISNPKNNVHYLNFIDTKNVEKKLINENIVSTVPFNEEGYDPVLKKYRKSISLNKNIIIYYSATSVYGSGIVDENSIPLPKYKRGLTRLKCEEEWVTANPHTSIFRISGIYGPDRHPMIKYLQGDNNVIVKEDYISNRIHVEDLSSLTLQFIKNNYTVKILNISDQKKVSSYDAIKFVSDELNLVKPKPVRYDPKKVSKMLKSFYEVNRTVKSNIINHKINYKFKYPDYKFALLGLTKSLIDSD